MAMQGNKGLNPPAAAVTGPQQWVCGYRVRDQYFYPLHERFEYQ